jgi:hypothetical protein
MTTNTVKTKNIGLITYHSAYNFGSVLQTYATQTAVNKLGHNVTVIDYRPIEGDIFYKHLYWRHQGIKSVLADFTMLPVTSLRRNREKKFEKFISDYLALSPHRYKQPEDLDELRDTYKITISGSDQIFNKHSN